MTTKMIGLRESEIIELRKFSKDSSLSPADLIRIALNNSFGLDFELSGRCSQYAKTCSIKKRLILRKNKKIPPIRKRIAKIRKKLRTSRSDSERENIEIELDSEERCLRFQLDAIRELSK